MSDTTCINKSDVLDLITETHESGGFTTYSDYSSLFENVDNMTAADVKPVVHSKWTYGEDESGKDGIFCSNCEGFVPWDYEYYDSPDELISDNPICSHCGAHMKEDE